MTSRETDRQLLSKLPKETLPDFILMHLRNLWAVDGLYYLGIEQRWGTPQATEVDQQVWQVMGKIEARRLKELLQITKNDIPTMMHTLQYSGWALDLEDKEIEISPTKAIIRNRTCRVQNTRLKKGLKEFGCKPVRKGYLESFAQEFNPHIQVTCTVCPPDTHPKNLWCEWIFTLHEK
ncbi:MAG: hypothetical protein KKC68_00370 [Candidatus Thermoplasmatota archaeon]|nr:hypothetical protein [Candidatus Thermoplasmatota archaeon]MBU1940206.1 hypothetical protein [Candidatus Thermoplasmatota archaeon]